MRRFVLAAALIAGACAQHPPEKVAEKKSVPDPRVLAEVNAFWVDQAEGPACAKSFEELADAEIETGPAPAWAGRYKEGPGTAGTRLTLAPRSGFLKTEWIDISGSETWTYGSAVSDGSVLHLRALRPKPLPGRAGELREQALHRVLDSDLVPITWGKRHYLVPEDGLQGFCREVHAKERPFEAFLRDGDEERLVSGRPRTPEAELRCLDVQPLEAHIIAVGPTVPPGNNPGREVTTPVVLDVGARDGVRRGMEFNRRGVKAAQLSFTVSVVKERTSEAEITYQPLYSDLPRVGWRVSTDWPPKD